MAKKIISKANPSKDDPKAATNGVPRRFSGVPANPHYQSSLRSLPHSSSDSRMILNNGGMVSLAPMGGGSADVDGVTMFKTKVLYHSNSDLNRVGSEGGGGAMSLQELPGHEAQV